MNDTGAQLPANLAVLGCPNSGKSLLFNKLTGLNQKVANFPGATTGTHAGVTQAAPHLTLVDFPGIYSLESLSRDEQVTVEGLQAALRDPEFKAVLCVLDTTRMETGLHLIKQVADACHPHGKPLVVAANMIDVLESNNMQLDTDGLGRSLGCVVVPVSARNGSGLDDLVSALDQASTTAPETEGIQPEASAAKETAAIIAKDRTGMHNDAQRLAQTFGPKGDVLLRSQTRIDQLLLHSWGGGLFFFLLMYLLFQSIFTWAAPLMDGVEAILSWAAQRVLPALGEGLLADFTEDALFGGIGAFLVFVPQIFILTIVVGILEDSGYLARAAVICHKPLRAFGLTGKSFIPMLSGVACAIPGIYAARTIESAHKRWLTYLAIPLMPCSARLPVYTLLIAAFIPTKLALGGLVGLQGFAMFAIYLFGIMMALLVTALVSRGTQERDDMPFVLEMPPYRVPSWRPLVRNAWERTLKFVAEAGPIIFAVTLVVWCLGYFPNHGADLSNSWLAIAGRWIEPVFTPFELDWRYGVAILTSFLAREVFVGTLGTLFGLGDDSENIISLTTHIEASGLPLASGVALLVFFAIAMQCISTLATLSRETGSWRLPIQLFIFYSFFAYGAAWIAFQICRLLANG